LGDQIAPSEGANKVARSSLLEIALVLVRLDYVARVIVNANHCIMRAAVELRVLDGIAGFGVPQATER
jgi:hypothetical protein